MKVTVTDNYLNVRSGKPSLAAPSYQYLAPGSELEVDGLFYTGDAFSGINTWMKDAAGNYYWSGGLRQPGGSPAQLIPTDAAAVAAFQSKANYPAAAVNWNSSLPARLQNTAANQGAGVRVGILDSGLDLTHLDLARSVTYSRDFTGGGTGPADIQGHGTAMAGLISGSAFPPGSGVTGIAPAALLYCAKVLYDGLDPETYQAQLDGLQALLALGVDIISMSIGGALPDQPVAAAQANIAAIRQLFQQTSNVVFLAATEEDALSPDVATLMASFPASCSNVLPVCMLSQAKAQQFLAGLPAPVVIVPDFQPESTAVREMGYYAVTGGSSPACAMVAAVTTLALAAGQLSDRSAAGVARVLATFGAPTLDTIYTAAGQFDFFVKTETLNT